MNRFYRFQVTTKIRLMYRTVQRPTAILQNVQRIVHDWLHEENEELGKLQGKATVLVYDF